MHDLIVRGGTIVDGTGAPAYHGDVAVTDGVITEVGPSVEGRARRVIDAEGLLVTPGFVDIHTHYDGQATWDPLLTPSCWHGVTTVVMGNCGVGFAPVRASEREWLIGLMEGVEDIPGTALHAGIRWGWESFPEYLELLDAVPHALDVGTQVPHGAIRAYVMGERGADNQPATPEDIAAMARLVLEGLDAGALGFSTSRTIMHMAVDGRPVPGTFAAEDELFGLGDALRAAGAGVFELAPAGVMGEDLDAPEREMAWMRRLAARTGRPVCFALSQNHQASQDWQRMLELSAQAAAEGAVVRPQVHARTVSLLLGLSTLHPFMFVPSWQELADRPIREQVSLLSDPHRRQRLVTEMAAMGDDPIVAGFMSPTRVFPMGDPPDYEPPPESSVAAQAAREGVSPWEKLYDLLRSGEGRELLNAPVLNYADGSLDPTYEMLASPVTAFGLGDGGAHVGQTCDASSTTFMLTHWVRDRQRGPRLPLELAVHKITGATADLYGLGDRGRLRPGLKADLNLIDFDRLQLRRPELVQDLPGGARRLVQRAEGYVATVNAGEVVMAEGEDTGARPGRLVRGARPARG
ncbi:N-acyl-D-amino-acid deacylase family protein [Rhabdothermincola sp.]|uniref:N-acyl-D-amino-acid deacylase family protein n=1 Tax=Rhabdothermincola sp. TaxID=2820405 RepID=UPI002FE1DE0C